MENHLINELNLTYLALVDNEYNGYDYDYLHPEEEDYSYYSQLEEDYYEDYELERDYYEDYELERDYYEDYELEKDYDEDYDEKEIEVEEKAKITMNEMTQIINLSDYLSKKQISYLKQHAENMKTGNLGESHVYLYERKKLEGTAYYNKVDRTKADVPMNGYDILSYTRKGEPIHIEVKATQKNESNKFEITDNQLETAKYMKSQGMKYVLYWVKDLDSENPTLEFHQDILDNKMFSYKPSKYIGEYLG